MNIIVFGAGAIGSFFGGVLSKTNKVILVGRKDHVDEINAHGLTITGKTKLNRKIHSVEKVEDVRISPDILFLTVKSFDTLEAISQAKKIISPKTTVLTIQNGLNNIDQIKKVIPEKQIIAGVTTHGVQFVKPGVICHKGKGSTIIGELNNKKTKRIDLISSLIQKSGIPVEISLDIIVDIWKKALINASINPLTAIFQCQNGYLSKNPILRNLIEKICIESVAVANKKGFYLSVETILKHTWKVIEQTEQNRSSMLQSILQGKPTEIDQINGIIVELGTKYGCNVPLNLLMTKIIKSI